MSETYKTAEINFITSRAGDIMRARALEVTKFFAVLYVLLNDGPYAVL